MFGTVARLKLKPGMAGKMMELLTEYEDLSVPGMRGEIVYQLDDDPDALIVSVVFDDRETYFANADSPEQSARYESFRALLAEEPEWNDGNIIYHSVS